jgi:hypothetical protein
VRDLGPEDTLPEPHLTLRVNGVKIAARGGSWGMDDAMKRMTAPGWNPISACTRMLISTSSATGWETTPSLNSTIWPMNTA